MSYDTWKLATPEEFYNLPDGPLDIVNCKHCNDPIDIWDKDEFEDYQARGFIICDYCHEINAEAESCS